eukprot:7120725-Prymnesium_polylepis.2
MPSFFQARRLTSGSNAFSHGVTAHVSHSPSVSVEASYSSCAVGLRGGCFPAAYARAARNLATCLSDLAVSKRRAKMGKLSVSGP